MSMAKAVARLAEEAELQLRGGQWQPNPADRALTEQAASDLADAVGPPDVQQDVPEIERLERLRTALAVLAVTIARVHGHLAWFLAAASTALAPVLHWRALPSDSSRSSPASPRRRCDCRAGLRKGAATPVGGAARLGAGRRTRG
ncbi:hypothetical protein [Streptomyces sp. TLI_171]|uniref:hypothetical protein n=1 Tax=Streptomyces sp. TLI_171 TaxID=1938859 RepID=UPI00117CABD0|nr:hypothetical protein [Streptomyces sp. TLI_171]